MTEAKWVNQAIRVILDTKRQRQRLRRTPKRRTDSGVGKVHKGWSKTHVYGRPRTKGRACIRRSEVRENRKGGHSVGESTTRGRRRSERKSGVGSAEKPVDHHRGDQLKILGTHIKEATAKTTRTNIQKLSLALSHLATKLPLALTPSAQSHSLALQKPAQNHALAFGHPPPSLCLTLVSFTLLLSHPKIQPCFSKCPKKSAPGC